MLKNWFDSIKNWFLNSETIFWARLQILIGVLWGVVSVTDMSPLLSPKWFAIWGIVNGVISELLRRRNSLMVAQTVIATPNEAPKAVTILETKPYAEVLQSNVVK